MNKQLYKEICRRHMFGIGIFILSVFIFSVLLIYYLTVLDEFHQEQGRTNSQKAKNFYSESQYHIYKEHIFSFDALKRKGVVGNDNRLQWLEVLQEVGEKYDIPAVDFTIENTVNSSPLGDYYSHPEIIFQTTLMTVNFKLLHEGDFFLLFSYLHEKSKGIFSVEACKLIRQIQKGAGNEYSGFVGECDLQWYTLKDINQDMAI